MNEQLDRMVAPYTGPVPEWSEVLRDACVQRRRRTLRGSLAVAMAAAAAVIALPLSGTPPTTLERALAAAGDGQILHLVFLGDLPKTLVDLQTGERMELRSRHEVWFDPSAGMRERETFAGVVQWDVSSGAAATPAHAREVYGSLLTGYREALRDGTARVVREDADAYWIRIAPGHDVAVSRKTYAPVDMRVGGMHNTPFVRYETVDSAPLQASTVRPQDGFGADRGATSLETKSLGRPPVWVGRTFQGHRLGAIRRLALPVGGGGILGLSVEYGDVLIAMAPKPADGITMLTGVRGYVPREGTLLLEGSSGLVQAGGLVVSIHSPDAQTTIAAARALRPYPA